MKTVLAPIDFSAATHGVIERSIVLARATDARLVLLHVVTAVGAGDRSSEGADDPAGPARAAAARLHDLQWGLRARGVTAHVVHVLGEARACILEQAERLAANYIVMGSRGHSAFYDLLVGATAAGVLQRAPCPVVIVPQHCASQPARDSRRKRTPDA